jgi:hypothetical protein
LHFEMSWDWSTEDVDSRLLFENMVCMVYLVGMGGTYSKEQR